MQKTGTLTHLPSGQYDVGIVALFLPGTITCSRPPRRICDGKISVFRKNPFEIIGDKFNGMMKRDGDYSGYTAPALRDDDYDLHFRVERLWGCPVRKSVLVCS